MPLCSASAELVNSGYTVVDNAFIAEYMPQSPSGCAEIYLFGLYLCSQPNKQHNTMEVMCRALGLKEEDVINGFAYWEEMGLVHVVQKEPIEVVYLSQKTSHALLKKIKAGKYSSFNKQIQDVISGRMITVQEYNEYYMFLETAFFQPEALVAVAKHCAELKGNDMGYNYILTVARNLATAGYTSAAAVEEKLANHPKFNEELSLVFKAMGLRRKIEFEDRRAYEKWTSDFGFSPDIVLKVAKRFKKGEIRKLDAALSQYFKLNLLSEREIESFESSKQELLELTREINRIIGYYHPSLELVAEEYVTPWTQKGYDGETLKLIARYCFRRRIQTLEGMNYTVDKFFKLGLLDADAINQYIERLLRYDENIRKLLDNMGVLRTVTAADRKNYALWIEDWQMSPETVEYASTLCSGALNPMSYLNKILSDFKQRGATTPEKAKALSLSPKTEMQEKKARPTGTERNYTAEQLAALFDNLDEIKI